MDNDKIIAKSNIANKIRNTSLSRKKGLMPLFELISNSIHSISERKEANLISENEAGEILITLIRNGQPETLASIPNNDYYPIRAIVVEDNGIGLNNDNLISFIEADSDHKLDIGGKGIGRFVCLKAFKWLEISSVFSENGIFRKRSLSLKNTKQGFENYIETEIEIQKYQTICTLHDFAIEFQKNTTKNISEIADAIITHFQLYFITNQMPHIVIRNQNNDQVDLNNRYLGSFRNKVQDSEFVIGDDTFKVYLSESNSSKSHRLHFCAHNRSVIEEWLGKKIIELGKKPISDNDSAPFYYAAFVVSDLLDKSVNNERTSFSFPTNEEDEDNDIFDTAEISLTKIRRYAINSIENLISDYINEVRTLKVETYRTMVEAELPQYKAVLYRKTEQVKKLQAGLSKQNLDIELYKIESEWKTEVKKQGIELIEKKKDITSLDEYHKLYEGYLCDLNDIGQSELARYITRRKSVIDLLDFLTSKEGKEDKYANEDLVHSLFFPIRTTSDVVPYNKQNLWMIDEKLSYHTYLASDKTFNVMENIEVSENPGDRPDLLIFSNAFAFATEKDAPYSAITIIEFKKPERDNYIDNDEAKNPIDQVERYVEDLLGGKITNRKGRTINITKETPFYIYIISDLTPTLIKILERRDFYKTPDGQGYYTFKSRRYNGYIEVMSFEKVKSDAKKRNQILFDKLGLPLDLKKEEE